MQPEMKKIKLSENGIIYISSGFDGPYVLQVIACRSFPHNIYQLCLTDGKLYIGGKYTSQNKINIQIYSLVRIQCKFTSRWSPIQIVSLQILAGNPNNLLGQPPLTINEYFLEQKENNCTSYHSASSQQSVQLCKESAMLANPRKKVKLTANQPQFQNTEFQPHCEVLSESQTQKIGQKIDDKTENLQNTQTQNIKFKSDSQSEVIIRHVRKQENKKQQKLIINLVQDKKSHKQQKSGSQSQLNLDQMYINYKNKKPQKIYMAEEYEIVINKDLVGKNQTHNVYVAQLYQRMMRWKILCKVVSLRTFLSAKGKKCAVMYLIDQKGDQIKAIYYYNKNGQNPAEVLVQGKVYSFSGGQVIKSTTQQSESLQIILDSKCQIIEYESIYIYPYSAKRITKFKDLLIHQQQINLIGIVRSFQVMSANASSYKSKPKIKGVLCSPLQLYEIQFYKTLYGGESQLKADSIYVFNNFRKIQSENAMKLVGSHNSYIVRINQQDLQYNKAKDYLQYKQLRKFRSQMLQNGSKWKNYQYYKLSQIKYSKRTVFQMKNIVNQTDSLIYSQIFVSIADIKLKKQYMACPVCKRSTIQQEHVLYQCLKCKKIVDPSPTLIISLVLADATGSFEIDVFGEKVSIFIGVQPSQFCSLNQQQKQCTLQIAKFSQFAVKVKSQRKNIKQLSHSLQQAYKQEHTLTMLQIRRRTVQEKLKLEQKWDQFD